MTNRTRESENNFTLLRLLLALMVVLGHFKLLSGTAYPAFPFNLADAAVDSFFVVSGFLIALSYDRSRG
jgi:peptidoglycan/LPS O-acetylase OafA/YrhL